MQPYLNNTKTRVLNAISVDVEDYFHTEAMSEVVPRTIWDRMPSRIEDNTKSLLELFAAHGVRGTFFFLGWVADRFPKLVQETASLGHEIGCHSYWHRMVKRLSPEEFREDTLQAKEAIENAAGARIIGYRAPSFSLLPGTEWAQEILADCGFIYDSSIYPVYHDLYANAKMPRWPYTTACGRLLELPLATLVIAGHNLPIGGGGYLRILPFQYTRLGISRVNRNETFRAILYTHPWEIDSEQPRLAPRRRSRLRQYTNLASTKNKLKKLIAAFSFAPIAETFAAEIANLSSPLTASTN